MANNFRWSLGAVLLVLLLGASSVVEAQPPEVRYNMKFRQGQNVQPVYEGWSKSEDGGFTMHFGYFNRNWVEVVHVPVGPDNRFESSAGSEIDAGQPTLFYPRANRRVFDVSLPSTFGIDDRVNWYLTVRGETLEASGWLQPEWETAPDDQGGRTKSEEELRNQAPVLTFNAPASIPVGNAVTLTARVEDDGLPVIPERVDRPGNNDPPTLEKPETELDAPHNVPDIPDRRGGGGGGGGIRGLRVSWVAWRGPAPVTFEAETVEVENGQAEATATFTQPGEYVLRLVANDNWASSQQDVTLTVR